MPYYYDINNAFTTNGSGGSSTCHLWGAAVANQETIGISGVYAASRFGTAGGAQLRINYNTGTIASGGAAYTPNKRNMRGHPAAQSTWKNDVSSTITMGTTLVTRVTVGFAQTGGMGGWQANEPINKLQVVSTTPVDVEFTSLATTASVTFDLSVEFGEGI